MGIFFKGIFIFLFSVLVMVALYGNFPADSSKIQQLIEKADGNEAAMKLVGEFFRMHPAPTVSELIHTKNEVDTLLVKHTLEGYNKRSKEEMPVTSPSPVELSDRISLEQASSLDKAAYAGCIALLIAMVFYVPIYAYQRLIQARDQS